MIPYADFRMLHRHLTRAEFLERVTGPYLLAPADIQSNPAGAHWAGVTTTLKAVNAVRKRTVSRDLGLFPLRKRPEGSPFADMMTIGRASNNDLVVAHPSVSWFHAYLRWQGGQWMIDDAGSSNGTIVDGQEVPPERPLASGSSINLGGAITLEFLEPERLYESLH